MDFQEHRQKSGYIYNKGVLISDVLADGDIDVITLAAIWVHIMYIASVK